MSVPVKDPDVCDRCEVIDEEHLATAPVVIGEIDSESVCHMCRRDELVGETFLSEREALVVALKQLGDMSHGDIAEMFKPSKSTIDEYSSRANSKVERAKRTIELIE
ncbi:hypothetical protein BRC92_00395 [Halobacteriales archaeon QS_4_69_31]|nr:MAG: hypothetical protein BRC92_00395 [Halobacteriales archaeon QS_4_69_31]